MAQGTPRTSQALAVRAGWLPCFPQFTKHNFQVVAEAEAAGAKTDDEIKAHVVAELRSRQLKFAMEDPDNPECFPRTWYIWRGNALQASAKGHEYFLRHYLGTHHNAIAEEDAKGHVQDVIWHEQRRAGKIDLIVDLNFRMDTSALYSDIVLPAATYYEKDDLNSTDMHSFIHPLQAAVPPCWESKDDWAIFREIAQQTSKHGGTPSYPNPVRTSSLDTADARHARRNRTTVVQGLGQGRVRGYPRQDDAEPNCRRARLHEKVYYAKFISLGPQFRDKGLSVHGTHYDVDDLYDYTSSTTRRGIGTGGSIRR
jgi:nitrate reductase alpha subunit